MLNFKPLTIDDRAYINTFIEAENCRSADFNFGNNYMWSNYYKQEFATIEGRLVIALSYQGQCVFSFPIGTGGIKPAVNAMRCRCGCSEQQLLIRAVNDEHKMLLEKAYPDKFDFVEDRHGFDYVYLVEKMATLAGKKLHSKRNHCNRFERENTWTYEALTIDNLDECLAMLDEWTSLYEGDMSGIEAERNALERGFNNFEALQQIGGVLRVNGKVVGFCMGEKIASDTIDVHFEKAFSNINGAYPMVSREFARMVQQKYPEIVYLNREDDLGHENLRKAKMDYHPEFLITKYLAVEKK